MNSFFAIEKLPQGYRITAVIDPIRNRKLRTFVIRFSLALLASGIALGFLIQPKLGLLFSGGLWRVLARFAVMAAAIAAYTIGHEAVHGALMWLYSGKKPFFGFKMGCAYAGSNMYFGKKAHMSIALAPLILWGAALTAAAFTVSADWFWVVWGIQLTNLSGSVGDLYMFGRVFQKPNDVLIKDGGLALCLYQP